MTKALLSDLVKNPGGTDLEIRRERAAGVRKMDPHRIILGNYLLNFAKK